MEDSTELERLRTMLLEAPESQVTRILAIALSTALLIGVLLLVRRRTLREEYTPIWLAVAISIAAVSIWPQLLLAPVGQIILRRLFSMP